MIEMDQEVHWKGLASLIEPHYPEGEEVCGVSVDSQGAGTLKPFAFLLFIGFVR